VEDDFLFKAFPESIHYRIYVEKEREKFGERSIVTLVATGLTEKGVARYEERHVFGEEKEAVEKARSLKKKWREIGTPGEWMV